MPGWRAPLLPPPPSRPTTTTLLQVLNTLKKASAVRRGLALGLLAAAGAYVRAQRVVDGVALQHAIQVRGRAGLRDLGRWANQLLRSESSLAGSACRRR